jgi:hypothetical protein
MDPALLYSIINTKLRNDYADLDDLVRSFDIDRDALEKHLAAAGFVYYAEQNQFRLRAEHAR